MSKDIDLVQIALPRELLQKLFINSDLKPKDLQCLNEQSKQIVRELCLQTCKPDSCSQCALQAFCATRLHPIQKQQIELISFTATNH